MQLKLRRLFKDTHTLSLCTCSVHETTAPLLSQDTQCNSPQKKLWGY